MSFTKFIKITTNHTTAELSNIEKGLNAIDREFADDLDKKFKSEFFEENGKVSMLAVIHENYIPDLLNMYTKSSVNFTYEDLTKDALYGKIDTTPYVGGVGGIEYNMVKYYLECFVNDNLDVDTVLEKISELGKESLNEKDMLVLKDI